MDSSSGYLPGLEAQLAQLRHAYKQLKAGTVKDQQSFADGLIAPAIRYLEAFSVHGCQTPDF